MFVLFSPVGTVAAGVCSCGCSDPVAVAFGDPLGLVWVVGAGFQCSPGVPPEGEHRPTNTGEGVA